MATFVGEGATVTALNSGGTHSVPLPAGVQDGDLLTLVCAFSTGCALASTPAGWAISAAAGGETPPKQFSGAPYAYHKVAGAGEPAVSITLNNGGGGGVSHFAVLAFRGLRVVSPVNASAYRGSDQNLGAGGSVVFPAVTTTVAGCVLFGFTSETQNRSATLTPGAGFTSTGDHSDLTPSFFASFNLTGGPAGTYTPAPATVAQAGRTFRSLSLALAPIVAGPIIGTQPINRAVTAGATATFTVAATPSGGGSLSYQWQRNGVDIAGANGTSYTTAATTVTGGTANSGDTYLCVITETGGTSPGVTTSSAATLTVNPAGDATIPTQTGAIVIGTVTASSIAFSWPAGADNVAVTSYEVSRDGGATWVDTASTGLSYTFTGLAASTSFGIRVRAKDAAGNVSTPALAATQSTAAGGDSTLPTLTGAITVGSVSFTSYSLSWPTGADNTAVAGYEVSFNGGASYLDNGAGTTRSVTGRTQGATDQVRVRAYDAAGNRSTPALSANVTLLTPTLSFPVVNNTNSPLINQVIPRVTVQALGTGNQALNLVDQPTNGSGNMVLPGAALTPGADYIVNGWSADGTQAFITKATAA